MTKIEIFDKIMLKAKNGGYNGDDYSFHKGFILDGTNIYSLIFREDFAKALWGEEVNVWKYGGEDSPNWKAGLRGLLDAEDKWKFLEEDVKFDECD